jgi:hypothetical protein
MIKKIHVLFLLLAFCLLGLSLASESAQSQENTCTVGSVEALPADTTVAIEVAGTLSQGVCAFTVPLKFRRGDDQDGKFTLDSLVLGEWVDTSHYWFVLDSISNSENFMYVTAIWSLDSLARGSGTLFTMYFTMDQYWDPDLGVKIDTTIIPVSDTSRLVFLDCTLGDPETLEVVFEPGWLGPSWVREVDFEGADLPQEFALGQNYPNPFNPTTVIGFALPEDGRVKIEVFNVLGQKITTLVDQYLTAGYKETGWDGKDSKGRAVGSGIYFYRICTEKFTDVRKMVLLK